MLLGHRGKDGSKAWQVRRYLNWRMLWGELRVRDRGKVKGKAPDAAPKATVSICPVGVLFEAHAAWEGQWDAAVQLDSCSTQHQSLERMQLFCLFVPSRRTAALVCM